MQQPDQAMQGTVKAMCDAHVRAIKIGIEETRKRFQR